MKAIKVMKEQLSMIQEDQAQCIDEYGIVKPYMKLRYKELCEEAKKYHDAINILEDLFGYGKEV